MNIAEIIRMATIECIDCGREWSEYDARTGSAVSTFRAQAAA